MTAYQYNLTHFNMGAIYLYQYGDIVEIYLYGYMCPGSTHIALD